MKYQKIFFILLISLLFLPAGLAYSQNKHDYQSEHYNIITDIGEGFASETAAFLEGFYDLYSGYMHFDPEHQANKMNVRIFAKKNQFDAYLLDLIGETRSSFVFLQYSDPKKNVLVGYSADEREEFEKKLIHHGFVQYIQTFIPNPPLWLQKGFAVYFENCSYDENSGKVTFHPNHSWVQILRSKISQDPSLSDPELFIPVENLLFTDQDDAVKNLEAFYAQTWGIIDFLIHSDKKSYNRLLWDAIASLSPTADTEANEARVVSKSFEWVNKEELVKDFVAHIQSIQTYPDLIQGGIDAYAKGNMDKAEALFQQALSLREDHFIPHYYLGLISYDRGEYSMAEYYYLSAVKNNGSTDLLYYALGVNAYADSRIDDSTFYLQQAVDAEGKYSAQASELIEQIAGDGSTESEAM